MSAAACGNKPMYCSYAAAGCEGEGNAIASCTEGTWHVDRRLGYAGSASSINCEPATAGAGGAAGAHD